MLKLPVLWAWWVAWARSSVGSVYGVSLRVQVGVPTWLCALGSGHGATLCARTTEIWCGLAHRAVPSSPWDSPWDQKFGNRDLTTWPSMLSPLPCCQLFGPVGRSTSWICSTGWRVSLACGLEVEHLWYRNVILFHGLILTHHGLMSFYFMVWFLPMHI